MATYRVRLKRPIWDNIPSVTLPWNFPTIEGEDNSTLYVLDESTDPDRLAIMSALGGLKYIAATVGVPIHDMSMIKIVGREAQTPSQKINLVTYPAYSAYSELCLYAPMVSPGGGSALMWCIGLLVTPCPGE